MNGEIVDWKEAKVHISTPFVAMAIAVFEGIRAYWIPEEKQLYVFRLSDHLDRLAESAKILRMKMPFSRNQLTESVKELLSRNNFREDVYLRIFVYLGGLWHTSEKVEACMFVAPRPSRLRTQITGIRCNISSWRRISDSVMPPRAKTCGNYVQWQLALNEARAAGFDNTILLTIGGKVSEAPGANIFMIRDSKLITPPRTSDILEGITRDTILKISPKIELNVEEREIDKTELYICDEAFLCGTGAEVTTVVSIDNIDIANGQPGKTSKEISKLYLNTVTGKVPGFRSWLTPIDGS